MTTPSNTTFAIILDTILLLISIISITYILFSTLLLIHVLFKLLNGSAASLGLAPDAELLDILEHVYNTNGEALSKLANIRGAAWKLGSWIVGGLGNLFLGVSVKVIGRRTIVEFFVQHCLMVPGATVDWKTGQIMVPEDFDFEAWKAERLDT
jgi:hypothetical protein